MLFRSILFQLGMWIFTIPFTLLSLLTFPAPPMYRYKFISLWAKTMLIWLKWTCNISFIIKGSANIPKSPFYNSIETSICMGDIGISKDFSSSSLGHET